MCLVLVLPNLILYEKDKLFLMKKVLKFSFPKTVETNFCQEFLTC